MVSLLWGARHAARATVTMAMAMATNIVARYESEYISWDDMMPTGDAGRHWGLP